MTNRKSPEEPNGTQEDQTEMDWEGASGGRPHPKAESDDSPGTGTGTGSPGRTKPVEGSRDPEAKGNGGMKGGEEGRDKEGSKKGEGEKGNGKKGDGKEGEGELVEAWEGTVQRYSVARATFLALVRQQLHLETVVVLAEKRAQQSLGTKRHKLREKQDKQVQLNIDLQLHEAFKALPTAPYGHTHPVQAQGEQQNRGWGRGEPVPYLQVQVLDCTVHGWNRDLICLRHTREEELPQQHQWEMREVACHRQHLDALNAPGAAKGPAPLRVQPLLMDPAVALRGLCLGATLEHCYLLGSVLPLPFLLGSLLPLPFLLPRVQGATQALLLRTQGKAESQGVARPISAG